MYIVLLTFHIIMCVALVAIVLFQVGKSGGFGGLFGGGSSDAVFTGASGNLFLKKVTAVIATCFILTSLSLSVMSARRPKRSLMDIMPPAPVLPENPLGGMEGAEGDVGDVVKSTG